MLPDKFAAKCINELKALPEMKTAPMRKLRREYSKMLRSEEASYVLEVAQWILKSGKHGWIAYEFIHDHRDAFYSLDREKLEELGQGMNSWSSVDSFSRTLSGPAWRAGIISKDTIIDWAESQNRWWKRAALVSTVAMNVRSRGGTGDVSNTLAICEMFIEDRDDMVVKTLSWALRELIVHNPIEVEKFICAHDDVLVARVKREVRNKLETGHKNP